jgi:hypothetical protein
MIEVGLAQDLQLYLVAGQSNAVGQGDSTLSPACPGGTAWEYVAEANKLLPLKDPFGREELNFQRAHTGSVAPALAGALYDRTGTPVVLIAAARGGASCSSLAELDNYGTWDTQGKLMLMPAALQKVKAAERNTGKTLRGVIWLQGERDANAINNGTLTASAYRRALESVILRFREACGKSLPFYIVQTGYYAGHPHEGFDAVRQVQEAVAGSDPNTFVVYRDTGSFAEKGWMRDAIHYNQTGLNHIGAAVAEAITNNHHP